MKTYITRKMENENRPESTYCHFCGSKEVTTMVSNCKGKPFYLCKNHRDVSCRGSSYGQKERR